MWWVILLLIPFVNIIGFALGLVFLAPIFYPILAWGDAQYQPSECGGLPPP